MRLEQLLLRIPVKHERVFHYVSNHPEESWKYSAMWRAVGKLRDVGNVMKRSEVFDWFFQSNQVNSWKAMVIMLPFSVTDTCFSLINYSWGSITFVYVIIFNFFCHRKPVRMIYSKVKLNFLLRTIWYTVLKLYSS